MRQRLFALGLAAGILALGVARGVADAPAPAAPGDVRPAGHAANQFMVDLYKKLAAEKGNVFFSPYSIASALTVAERGARRKTAEEMALALHLPESPVELGRAYAALSAALQADGGAAGYQLSVANAVWPQQGEALQKAFLDDVTKTFLATAQPVDFINDPSGSRKRINDWISDKTKGKITDLMAEGSVSSSTRMVISSAVYFKGNWAAKFNPAGTQTDEFHVTADKSVEASLMHMKKHFNYTADGKCQAIELPYKGNEVAMVLLLPVKSDHDAGKLGGDLTLFYINDVLGRLADHEVELTMPKWKLTCYYNLTPTLESLGMRQAFTPEADFSGINGHPGLYLGTVAHKAFIQVNEESTEAAAATGVDITIGVAVGAPKPIQFVADRPFLYFIYQRTKKTVLFIGRLSEPAAE